MTKFIALPDIDIDVIDRSEALKPFSYIDASMLSDDELKKHPTGVFFQDVPIDTKTGLAAFSSGAKSGDIADRMGFFKVDLINNKAYHGICNPDHLSELVAIELDWSLFDQRDVIEKLQHINNHADIVIQYMPRSILDLAIIIALIRPAKKYLIGEPWNYVQERIWIKEEGYSFKKSHAISYALMITIQLKLLIQRSEV